MAYYKQVTFKQCHKNVKDKSKKKEGKISEYVTTFIFNDVYEKEIYIYMDKQNSQLSDQINY